MRHNTDLYFLLIFAGTLDINTKGTDSTHIVTIGSKTVVMSCLRGDGWKLVRYNLKNGAEVDSASLQRSPDGLAEVHMSSKDCVAVAYGYVLSGTMWNFKKYIDERQGCSGEPQGSHSDWKNWKTWKNGKAFSSQGKVREF